MKKGERILIFSVLIVAGLYFLFLGLVESGPFLIPLLTAMVMALLMLPVNYRLEAWGFSKGWATLASTLILLVLAAGFVAVLFFQVRIFAEDWEKIQKQMTGRLQQTTQYLIRTTPLEEHHVNGLLPGEQQEQQDQEGKEENGDSQSSSDIGRQALSVVQALLSFLVDFILTFVYVFLFMFFRNHFKGFILRMFPREKRDEVATIISRTASVSRGYLAGRLLLMVSLTALYYTGLAITGLDNAFIISLLAAALSIVPNVGNILAYILAVFFSLLTNYGGGEFLGITITFIVAQFVDSYILQPIVLGGKVDVHPFFIIVTVILGWQVWGVMGMVLAIPLFGMISVVCRHVPSLNPFGYLFSNKEIPEPDEQE